MGEEQKQRQGLLDQVDEIVELDDSFTVTKYDNISILRYRVDETISLVGHPAKQWNQFCNQLVGWITDAVVKRGWQLSLFPQNGNWVVSIDEGMPDRERVDPDATGSCPASCHHAYAYVEAYLQAIEASPP